MVPKEKQQEQTSMNLWLLPKQPLLLTGIMKEQYQGGTNNNNCVTTALIGKTTLALPTIITKSNTIKEGDNPRTIVLKHQESHGEGGKGPKCYFYCQQEHAAKLVGRDHNAKSDVRDTICTEADMKIVKSKADMKNCNLTPQTCSMRSDKCIFVLSKFADF